MDKQTLRHLAQLGAAARLAQLETERAAILRAFPELARAGRDRELKPIRVEQYRPELSAERFVKPKRVMSPAQRKAVSVRMTKYWAARRKAKA